MSLKGLARRLPLLVLILVCLGSTASAVYFYHQFSTLSQDPQAAVNKQNAALVSRVSRLIVLPADEQPTIAVVNDLSKLKDQTFFAQAKIGDNVLVYTSAKKAILYDPTADKIVEVAPINIGAAAATNPSTTSGSATTGTTTTTDNTTTTTDNSSSGQ